MRLASAEPPRPGIITSSSTTSGVSRTICAETPNGVAHGVHLVTAMLQQLRHHVEHCRVVVDERIFIDRFTSGAA